MMSGDEFVEVPIEKEREDLEREVAFFRERAKSETDPIERLAAQVHAEQLAARLREQFCDLASTAYRTQRPNAEAQAVVEARRRALLAECRKHMTDAEIATMTDVRKLRRTSVAGYLVETYGAGKDNQTLTGDLKAIRSKL